MLSIFLPVGVLLAASLLTLSSVAFDRFVLQAIWGALGLAVMVSFRFFDWRAVFNQTWVVRALYGASIASLILVYFTAPEIRNVRGWFDWGPIHFQPVELMKVSLVLLFAHYFSRLHVAIAHWRTIVPSFLYFVIPAGLVALQPDLGSALVLFGIWFGFLLVSGLPRKRLVLLVVVGVVMGVVLWGFILRDYQRARIVGVFYPEQDVLGINYSVAQSKIAIGSSGFLGKGYGQGSQAQLKFLTEPATDFILAAFIEEWGILGGVVVIGAFFALLLRILFAGLRAERNVEKFICLGAATVFAWQFVLNVGSATGLFPVVGVTFPFLSYGGSSLLTNFLLLGIVNAIAVRS